MRKPKKLNAKTIRAAKERDWLKRAKKLVKKK